MHLLLLITSKNNMRLLKLLGVENADLHTFWRWPEDWGGPRRWNTLTRRERLRKIPLFVRDMPQLSSESEVFGPSSACFFAHSLLFETVEPTPATIIQCILQFFRRETKSLVWYPPLQVLHQTLQIRHPKRVVISLFILCLLLYLLCSWDYDFTLLSLSYAA